MFGPSCDGRPLSDIVDGFMRPPYFPIRFSDLRGEIRFHDVDDGKLSIGEAEVLVRPVPHTGPTVGYRVRWDGATVAYVSDHQAPLDLVTMPDSVLELARDADLLIHDAQYTVDEFAEKPHWGHCTVDFAVELARAAGVRKLVLFHHDPSHDDDAMDELVGYARTCAGPGGPEIIGAYEGLRLAC